MHTENRGSESTAQTPALLEPLESRLLLSAGQLVLTSYLGGNKNENIKGITIDAAGDKTVCGWTSSSDFLYANNSIHVTSPAGNNDTFVAKYNSSNRLLWSTYIGGSADFATGTAIAGDAAGNTFVTGRTKASNLAGAINAYHAGRDVFLAKVSPSGATLWTIYLGGSSDDSGESVAVDSSGNVYVAGYTQSSDFAGATGTFGGTTDAFVAKVSTAGAIQWVTFVGGSGDDEATGIAVTNTGETLISGTTTTANLPLATNTFHGGASDAFVARIDASGALEWATYLGGSGAETKASLGSDSITGVALDSGGNALVTGYTESTSLSRSTNSYHGVGDAVLYKVTPAGTLLWSCYLGGNGFDAGMSVTLDAQNNAIVAGMMNVTGAAMPPTGGSGLLAKVDTNGSQVWSTAIGGSAIDIAEAVAIDNTGAIWLGGGTWSTNLPLANDTAGGADTTLGDLNSTGPYNAFVAKVSDVPTPTVTAINPLAGAADGGTSVTITGTDLLNATAVKFGTQLGTIVSNTATQIVATCPGGAVGTMDVTVTTAGGTSFISPDDKFSYAAAPTLASLSQNQGSLTGGTTVTIKGTSLLGAAVDFGDQAAAIVTDTATQIVVTSPAGADGIVDVTVTTAGGTSAIVSTDRFTYGSMTLAGVFGTPWTLPPSVVGGKTKLTGTIPVVLSNMGDLALPTGQQVNILVEARDITNPANTPITLATLKSQSVSKLKAGGLSPVTFRPSVAAGIVLPADTYQIWEDISPVQVLPGVSTDNWVTDPARTIVSKPAFVDLAASFAKTLTAWTGARTSADGKTISVPVVITNVGNVPLDPSLKVNVQINAVGAGLTTVPLKTLTGVSVASLGNNKSVTATTTVTLPPGMAAGAYNLQAVIDTTQVTGDTNSANNTFQTAGTLTVTTGYLGLSGTFASSTLKQPSTALVGTVVVSLKNIGKVALPAGQTADITVGVVDASNVTTQLYGLLGEQISPLAANGVKSISLAAPLISHISTLATGTYTIEVTITLTNNQAEFSTPLYTVLTNAAGKPLTITVS